MTKISKTIVFFGSGPVAAKSLDFLCSHFTVEAVITKATPLHHKGEAPTEELAKAKKLPLLFANTKDELDTLIVEQFFQSSVGLIVDYGVIVSQQTISSFPLGIINSHFSLLPQWRGADPITFAILSGQPKTGVSLMLIEPELDTGKLLAQKSLPISPNDTTPSLTTKLIDLSNKLLLECLPKYLKSQTTLRNQPHPNRATYSRKLTKDDGLIDWTKPAMHIEREIRAFLDWPKSRTSIAGKEVIITRAHIVEAAGTPGTVDTTKKQLIIYCGQQALQIDQLKPAGKAEMSGPSFLHGYRL